MDFQVEWSNDRYVHGEFLISEIHIFYAKRKQMDPFSTHRTTEITKLANLTGESRQKLEYAL